MFGILLYCNFMGWIVHTIFDTPPLLTYFGAAVGFAATIGLLQYAIYRGWITLFSRRTDTPNSN